MYAFIIIFCSVISLVFLNRVNVQAFPILWKFIDLLEGLCIIINMEAGYFLITFKYLFYLIELLWLAYFIGLFIPLFGF